MPPRHATPLLLLSCAMLTSALPEALPEARAEADPKAVPQLYGGPGGGQGYNPGTGGGYTGINTDPSGGQGYNPGGGSGYADINTDPSGGQGYNPGTGGGGVWGLRPSGDQGPSPGGGEQCGMAEQCCGMAEKGCCQEQGQKCYTVYERKCRHANKPVCQTMTKEFCDTYPVKQCRRIRKPEVRDIPITDCRPQMERKCFEYDGKECEGGENSHAETYRWVNQELVKLPDKNITKCHDITTCNIQVANQTLTRRVPKRKCEDVPNPRRTCRSVQVPQAPYEMPTMSYRTEYKRQCYKVSRPVCRHQPLQQPQPMPQPMPQPWPQPQPQQPCPYQVVQKNICPTCLEPSYPGRGCGTPSCRTPRSPRSAQGPQDIIPDPSGGQGYNPGTGGQDISNLPGNLGQGWAQGGAQGIITDPNGGQGYNPGGCGAPVGGGGTCGQSQAMCGSCRQQPVQVCQSPGPACENKEEEVCQQVPVRVPVPGTRTVQPPPKWEVKCEVQQETVQRCRVEYEVEEYTVQKRGCTPGTEEKCFQYKVPDYELVVKNMNETLQFNTSKCTVVNVRKEHCADLPTRIDCEDRTVKQSVMINQMVCDREKMARYCHRVPYSYCKNVPGQECSMEPRQVCQPACQQNNYCNQCTQFAASGGFSQCQTTSCPNYIGAPADGEQIPTNLPGNLGQGWAQGPQGITDGGQGYNPGNGK